MSEAPKPVVKPLAQRVTFEQLIRKVQQAEDVLEMRERQVATSYQRLRQAWNKGWTPLRIITVGLASGFLVGRSEPLRALSGPRLLQMVSALSGLFASAQASFAAEQAQEAADTAEDVAVTTAEAGIAEAGIAEADAAGPAAAGRVTASARAAGIPDPRFSSQPRAAEAATEISEH